MRMEQVRVQNYKCIEDSGWVDFERVTCLVGKNESGKTAFLEALQKLNPVDGTGDYDALIEYPRRRYRRYMNEKHEDDPDPVASARFKLSSVELEEIREMFGEDILEDDEVVLTKDYKNNVHWDFETDEDFLVESLLSEHDLHRSTEEFLEGTSSFEELVEKVEESAARFQEFQDLERAVQRIDDLGLSNAIAEDVLVDNLPEFLYFDEYFLMEGQVDFDSLIRRENNGNLSDADETFLSLLSIAGLDIQELRDTTEYERIIAELEAASNLISDDVFEYWSQGPDLEVQFDKAEEVSHRREAQQQQGDQQQQGSDSGPVLHVRVRNNRHRVSVSFDERSSGFIWFFSFLAYFSDLESEDRDLILLLDEPGLNLHAKAQHDFIRFINERLSPSHPVVYTTHSPFMLEPKNLQRARLVIDDPDEGTRISDDVLESDEDTNFPLQAVLGYDLIQTLLIGPQCLLVEGKSDMTYLQVMSDILEERDQESLSHRWTLVPVGGADNVPTFVSLFGASDLDIGVLLDDDSEIDDRLRDLEARRIFDMDNIRTISEYREEDEEYGDIEDLFSREFYLELVNDAYRLELRDVRDISDELSLDGFESEHPRITYRLEQYFDRWHVNEGMFEHHTPSSHFQKRRDEFEDELDDESLDRFEALFEDMNSIIE